VLRGKIDQILQATNSHDRARKSTDSQFIRQQFVNEQDGNSALWRFSPVRYFWKFARVSPKRTTPKSIRQATATVNAHIKEFSSLLADFSEAVEVRLPH
jgi:hypothetical protein